MAAERQWRGRGWQLTVSPEGVDGEGADGAFTVTADDLDRLRVRRRWFRWQHVCDGNVVVRLRGATRHTAKAIDRMLRLAALWTRIDDATREPLNNLEQ